MGNLPTWDDPDKLQTVIDRYFDNPENKVNPTVCGLALELGFDSRSAIYSYKDKPGFESIIKKALMRVENAMEIRCGENGNCAGAIFRLKNHGWSDKSEVEHSGLLPPPSHLTVTIAKDSIDPSENDAIS